MQTVKSFKDLARAMREQEDAQRREDVRKAANLRKSAHLAKRGTGRGPRVAR